MDNSNKVYMQIKEEAQNLLKDIEKKQTEQIDLLSKVRENLTKFRNEERVIEKNLDLLEGAKQAYNNVIQLVLLKEHDEKETFKI